MNNIGILLNMGRRFHVHRPIIQEVAHLSHDSLISQTTQDVARRDEPQIWQQLHIPGAN